MTVECILEDQEKLTRLTAFIVERLGREFPESHLIAVLHKAQDIYGYLDTAVLRVVAEKMRIPIAKVMGVATFYHYFSLTPRGKYMISVCMGTACYVKGAQKVLEAIKKELGVEVGETTTDMAFTLLETRCLGACGLAPTVMVNNRIYGEMTPKKAVEVLMRMRKELAQNATRETESAQ
jgi:NADH:ubiquinone oxidoreductase subunit E